MMRPCSHASVIDELTTGGPSASSQQNPQVLQHWAAPRQQGLEHVDKRIYAKTMIAMLDALEHVAPTGPLPLFAAQVSPALAAPAAAAPPPQQPFAVPAPILARRRGVCLVEIEARAASRIARDARSPSAVGSGVVTPLVLSSCALVCVVAMIYDPLIPLWTIAKMVNWKPTMAAMIVEQF
jgi:hypothetical protein